MDSQIDKTLAEIRQDKILVIKSYAQVATIESKIRLTPLKNTSLCSINSPCNVENILTALEEQNLDEDLTGLQLIRFGTLAEIVMKTDTSKNTLLERALNIKGEHHRLYTSRSNRTPNLPVTPKVQRTTVSIS